MVGLLDPTEEVGEPRPAENPQGPGAEQVGVLRGEDEGYEVGHVVGVGVGVEDVLDVVYV